MPKRRGSVNAIQLSIVGQFEAKNWGMLRLRHMRHASVVFLLATVLVVALMKVGYFLIGLCLGLIASASWPVVFLRLRRNGSITGWYALAYPVGLFWPLLVIRWTWGAISGDAKRMLP